MTADNQSLPPLPEIASVFTFADLRVALTNYGAACAAHARKAALEEAAKVCESQTETHEETTYADIGAAAIRELLK